MKAKSLMEVYLAASPDYTGSIYATLYDAKSNKIVSNDNFWDYAPLYSPSSGTRTPATSTQGGGYGQRGRTMDAELGKRVYVLRIGKDAAYALRGQFGRVFRELDRLEHMLADVSLHLLGGDLSLTDIQYRVLGTLRSVYFRTLQMLHRRLSSLKLYTLSSHSG
jgi:glutathionyl-hydroquinone reductase